MKPIATLALPFLLLPGSWCPPLRAAEGQPPVSLERRADGIILARGDSFLKVEVCADDTIRVACAADRAFFTRASLMVDRRRAAHEGVRVRYPLQLTCVEPGPVGVAHVQVHARAKIVAAPHRRPALRARRRRLNVDLGGGALRGEVRQGDDFRAAGQDDDLSALLGALGTILDAVDWDD